MANTNHNEPGRINQTVDYHTELTLKRLAYYFNLSEAKMLEAILKEAQSMVLTALKPEQQNDYYDMKLRRRHPWENGK